MPIKLSFCRASTISRESRCEVSHSATRGFRRSASVLLWLCAALGLFLGQALAPAYALAAECNDGIDNDGDGRQDFPADLGCLSADDVSEVSDRDQDGITDQLDLCINAWDPTQQDTDGDSFGNACDADYDQDLTVTAGDFAIFLAAFAGPGTVTDHDGDGLTTAADFAVFLAQFSATPAVPGPSGPMQIAPLVSALEMDSSVFPVPAAGQRFPLTFRFSFEDSDVDLAQLVVGLDGPAGSEFRLFDDFSTGDVSGVAERLISLDSSFGPGDYTLSVQLIDAAENPSSVESVLFTLDAGMAPPIQITSISPASAAPGDIVQISGSGFTDVPPDQLRVTFPGSERSAEISSVVFDELNVIVPAGALSGPIVLETPLGMIPSAASMTVPPTITLTPDTHELLPGESLPLSCRVSGIENALVDWTVSAGTVDETGVFTAPAILPPVNPVGVRCAWQGDPGLYAESLIEILPPTPMPGQTMVLASEGGEVFTEVREVEVQIEPLALPSDTDLVIQVPPRSVFPPDQATDIIPASAELTPAGITFGQPATATFQLRHWMEPGTTIQTYRSGIPVALATVEPSGIAAVAALPSTGLYNLQSDLAVSTDYPASILEGLLGQAQEFEITRPRGTEWLEGLRIPILIQSTTAPPAEVGPFFEGVEVEASLDGYGPLNVGPRVQPDATAWQVGTILDIPVLTDCGTGQSRDGTVFVRYPAASGSTAELTLDFTIDCLDELEFALGQPPVPVPAASFWDEHDGRSRLRLIPTPGVPTHRYSRVVIGTGAELAPYQGNPFSGPLTVEVTRDVRVETGGRVSTETFVPPADPRQSLPIDGGRWYSTGFLGTGIAPGEGGDTSHWYGAMGGDGGGGTSDHGSNGDSSSYGGIGGEGGLRWQFADWLSVVTAAASTVFSVATQNWVGAAEGVFDVTSQSVLLSEVEANRMRGTGRGGRAAASRQLGLSDPPHGGGGGGGSGKMIHECNFIFDFCPDAGGQGGGGGGGGAHPLEFLVGGSVFVDRDALIMGRGGPGGFGGVEIGGAPGGGGAGGNGAYIRISASSLFNLGTLTVEGGLPGLSVGCVCPSGVGCITYDRVCTGDRFVIRVGNGEKGRDGLFQIEGWMTGQFPPASQLSYSSTPSDPWMQIYDFPFTGLGDSDGDGLKDGLEDWIGTRPDSADTDLDGLSDYDELIEHGTNPTLRDTDGDGLSDGDELTANPWITDPLLSDTDGDGVEDGLEVDRGSDPTNENSTPEVCDGVDNDLDTTVDEDCEVRIDHKGREFFIPFLKNEGIGTTTLSLRVTSEGFADVTVEYPVGTPIGTWPVTPDQEAVIPIPNGASNVWPMWSYPTAPPTPPLSGNVSSNAVRVTSTFDVAVMAYNSEPGTRDKALALPTELLGMEYYVLAESPAGPPTFGPGAHFVVVATEDDTTVTVEGIDAGLAPVSLDRGEGVAVQSWYGVHGVHVVADKKVALANGNRCTEIPANGGSYCSHLYEISLPVERWENEYLAATSGAAGGLAVGGRDVLSQKRYSIVAAQDGTTLTVNGSFFGVLDAGGVVTIRPVIGENMIFAHIEADKPIFGTQFMYSLCSEVPGDPGCTNVGDSLTVGGASMANLIPVGRYPRLSRFQGADAYTLVVPTADASSGSVLVDGVAINPANFDPFPSAPSWSVNSGTFGFPNDVHTLESPAGHGAWLINAGFGSGATAPLGYDYDLPHTQPMCSGDLSYDGGASTWHHAVGEGFGVAVRFTPPSYPWTLDLAEFWPWSNSDGLDFEVHVWDDNGMGGLPGSDLITPFVHHATSTDQWEEVGLPSITIQSGEFYVGWVQTAGGLYYNGRDGDSTMTGRSYVLGSGGWVTLSSLGDDNDMMIRQSCR